MEIIEKCFVLTGGAGSLGRVIGSHLEAKGGRVILLDKNSEAIKKIQNTDRLIALECDITDPNSIENSITKGVEKFGKIHCLINNAGVLHSEPLINIVSKRKRHSIENWSRVLAANLTGPFIVSNIIVEHMITNRTKGVIVNLSSISSQGNIGQTAYSASKAGLEAMTKVWAKELGFFGIRSFAISPGFIDSESTDAALNEKIIDHLKTSIPLKRLGRQEEVAKLVISSIENDYLNSCVINIDGGLTI